MGFLDAVGLSRLRAGLAKTRDGVIAKVMRLASGRRVIDEALLEEVEEILIAGDVGAGTAGALVAAIRERVRTGSAGGQAPLAVMLKEEVQKQFGADRSEAEDVPVGGPKVIMVVGINGVGKTTTIGKLARRHVAAGRKVFIAAADTFRAAANEQISIWAQRAGASLIQHAPGADPAAVAFDALRSAEAHHADLLIIDTAGRLHTKINLMEELKKIRRVLQKQNPAAPHEVLLVIDATTGQNGLQQARQFAAAVGVTGVVLTKLDGTAKGGIVLAIARELGIPVRYVGVGETMEDLQPFDRAAFVEALFGEVPAGEEAR
jgi:fused signal recognition particle receptor